MQVVVIGDGPAGSTVALELSKQGISVLVVGKLRKKNANIGESLPPSIKPLLQSLGVWQQFLQDKHLPLYGNHFIWGNTSIQRNDFILNPYGHGWHLNRIKFDKMLIHAASQKGAIYLKSDYCIIEKDDSNNWHINILTDNNHNDHIQAQVIIDASGRTSYISRKENINRIFYDHLIGIISTLNSECPDSDCTTFVESCKNGWWYTTRISEHSRIVIFFTYSNLPVARFAINATGWKKLLQDTLAVRDIIESAQYNLNSKLYYLAANTSKLENIIGIRWIAIGDSAAAYDPLSSQGIMMAMNTAIGAANAILWYLRGKSSAFSIYENKVNQVFYEYLNKRAYFYNIEQRWWHSDFWERARMLNKSVQK